MIEQDDFAKLLNRVALAIEAGSADAMAQLVADLKAGKVPQEVIREALRTFEGAYYVTLAEAYSKVLGVDFGIQQIRKLPVSGVQLSTALYQHSQAVSAETLSVVRRHAQGMHDARKLAMDIYEGYGFRPKETIVLSPSNPKLPKYLRQTLTDAGLRGELSKLIAGENIARLKTAGLRAGYAEALDAIIEGAGEKRLQKRLDVAFNERMRYFASRIAITELARVQEDDKARAIMADGDLEYVQYSLSQRHPKTDICDFYAKMNKYGLGPGIYPKALAPKPPLHPHCLCTLRNKYGLTGDKATENPSAERDFLLAAGDKEGPRIAGSFAKWQLATDGGADLRTLINAGKDPLYHVKTVSETVQKP
jgi:hypothetical protein